MNPRLLKIAVVTYAVKTLLVGLAWLAVPDLPQKAMDRARQTWTWVSSRSGR